jgi:transcriptional regulator with XRE-family HTH domain
MRGAIANGEYLQAVRVTRALTQEQLATLADVDVKTVRKAEQGKRLDVGTLARLALALGTELHRIIRGPTPLADLQTARRITVEKWRAAWDARDFEALLALYDDRIVLHLPGGPHLAWGGEFHGKEAIRRVNKMAWSLAPMVPVAPHDRFLIVCEDCAVLYGKRSLRLPDEREILLSSMHLFAFAGRLIVDHRVEYDTLAFSQALQPLAPDSGQS